MNIHFTPLPTEIFLKAIQASIAAQKEIDEYSSKRITHMLRSITTGTCVKCCNKCPKWPPEHIHDMPEGWHICKLEEIPAFIICKECFKGHKLTEDS